MDAEELMGTREGEALQSGREREPCGAEVVLAERPHLWPLQVAQEGAQMIVPGGQGLGSVHLGYVLTQMRQKNGWFPGRLPPTGNSQ